MSEMPDFYIVAYFDNRPRLNVESLNDALDELHRNDFVEEIYSHSLVDSQRTRKSHGFRLEIGGRAYSDA